MEIQKKTVVIGLDGATWKLLKPFAEKGYMPVMARLLESGVHARLESTMPAMTGPSWSTFATGKHPGKHGVFDFILPTDTLENMKFATSEDVRGKTIYELLDDAGLKSVLINLPNTYPPRIKNEATITSLLTQGDEWIFPASLKDEFPELQKYRLTPDESLRLKDRAEQYIEDLLVHMDEQMSAVKRLYEEKDWDFFFYLFSHSDWVSHLTYITLEEQHDESARRVFEKIDEYLGWFEERIPEGGNMVIVSDHGFKGYKKAFYFNRWLEQEGYLVTNTDSDSFRAAATRRAKETDKIRGEKKRLNVGSGVFEFLSKHPSLERSAKWLYHNVVKKYLPVNVKVNVGVDFTKTQVCFPKGSYITNAYMNKDWVYKNGTVSKEEYVALRDEVMQKMRDIKDPEGNPVIANVFPREEVYGDDAPDQAPDIFFELADYWLVGQFQSAKLFAEEEHNKHDQWGVFLAVGPDFAEGTENADLKMQDMTPLLLHLMGLAVPEDCDGAVPKEVLVGEAAERAVASGPATGDFVPGAAASTEKAALDKAIGNITL